MEDVTQSKFVYHLAKKAEWEKGQQQGLYTGSSDDTSDGFLHFSAGKHIEESCRLYRRGESDLVMIQVDTAELKKSEKSGELKWDPVPSRGEPFPHLYGPLEVNSQIVPNVWELVMDAETGYHTMPENFQ